MVHKLGLIDLGSNSVRLAIYQYDETGVVQEIDNLKTVIRLSSRMTEGGEINEQGINELIHCLKRYKQFCDQMEVEETMGVATAAIRSASNRDKIRGNIYRETQIDFRVLSGEEEAYYGYLAVVNSMSVPEAITVDLGGGSTEVTYFRDREILHSFSFPFGAVTLTDSYLKNEIPVSEDIDRLKRYLIEQFSSLSWIKGKECPVIVIGGTARNVARMHQRQTNYSMSSFHQYTVSLSEVEEIFHRLRHMPLSERKEVNGLSKDRADIIIAGLAVFLQIMKSAGSKHLITSSKGLRDGLLFEKLLAQKGTPVLPDVLDFGSRHFMSRYRVNYEHAEYVANHSLRLYEELRKLELHSFGEWEKTILRTSALLHHIGRSINITESSLHTYYLLENVLLTGASHRERLMIGLVASYKNTKQLRKLAAKHSDILLKEDEKTAQKLGMILLLARMLDRYIDQRVINLTLKEVKKKIELHLYVKGESPWAIGPVEDCLSKLGKVFKTTFILQEILQEETGTGGVGDGGTTAKRDEERI